MSGEMIQALFAALICGVTLMATAAGEEGIAAKYPGDAGIENDPDVVLAENFEGGSVDAVKNAKSPRGMHGRRWSGVLGAGGDKAKRAFDVISDAENVHSGRHALQLTFNEHTAGHTGGLFTRLKEGVDTLHVRMYMKFAKGYPGASHAGTLVQATHEKSPWFTGGAGKVPGGNEKLMVSLEPVGGRGKEHPGNWGFYNYWHEMKGRWGNKFDSKPPAEVVRGKWTCVELMVKLNSGPAKRDGECAFWVDGSLSLHLKEIYWRTSTELKLNTIFPHQYINRNGGNWRANQKPRVQWRDDIVVAKRYIGPMAKREAPADGKPEAAGPGAWAGAPPAALAHKEPSIDPKAAKLFRDARHAERSGMKSLARRFYQRLVDEHPSSPLAEKAKARL